MKLLFVAPSAYVLGGVQNWLDYLLPGLEDAGLTVTLCLVDGHWHRAGKYLDTHPWHRTRIVDNPTGSAMGRVNALMRVIGDERPDVVVVVNIGDAIEAAARLKQRQGDAPRLVYTIHGIQGDYFTELAAGAGAIDGVVVTNRLTAKLVGHYTGMATERLHYAPYGVAIPESRRDAEDTANVLWMGRIEQPQKRALELPGIAAHLAGSGEPWKIRVAGTGPAEDALKKTLVSDGSLTVEFLGGVSHRDILKETLPGAGQLLVNSSWETGPITIWEAMAAGVPVVSSRYTGSVAEAALVDGVNALLFDVGDTRAAADAMIRLRRDPALRAALVESGRRLVGDRYSIAVSIDAWRRALDKIATLPGTRADSYTGGGVSPRGRLDHWLGVRAAEAIRRLGGRSWRHHSAGAEWPHVRHGMTQSQQAEFTATANALDNV